MRYALLAGGKRLRPALAWHSCVAVGGSGVAALPAAAAVELVHAFSLVHDDLPAMDDDDLRRGRATLHRHAGEAMAILAGDAMLALAFRVVAERSAGAVTAALSRELAAATGRMIAGQVKDMGLSAGVAPGLDGLRAIHADKTGALIRAACVMGALSAAQIAQGGGPRQASIEQFGAAAGLLYQVVDDLLDATATSEQAGKRTRKDADAGKVTYPGLLGIEGSRHEVERLRSVALGAVDNLGGDADGLRALCELMARRER
ncbi:MAG: polyprenyl synthetase family protein [Phycisphaerales bacterium]|nr:polyprenyl synthetase family protein [Phycisphaerales bacterium]